MAMYACMLVYVCGILHERLPLYQYNSVLSLHIPSRARGIHEIQQIITTTPHIRLNSEFIDEFWDFFRVTVCCNQYLSWKTDLRVLNLRCNLWGGEEWEVISWYFSKYVIILEIIVYFCKSKLSLKKNSFLKTWYSLFAEGSQKRKIGIVYVIVYAYINRSNWIPVGSGAIIVM